MILELLIVLILGVMSLFASLFPDYGTVPLLLPFGLDGVVSSATGIWVSFMQTFPYAIVAWHMLLWVVLPFELLMLVFKMILGSRLPAHLY